jgi:hypothetical protein
MIQLHDIDQGSDGWLEKRKDLYTGSGAEKLLKHSGQLKVVDGVATPYALAEITGFTGNFYTKRGHMLEDEALEIYQQIRKKVGIRFENGNRVGFVTNSKFPTCGYSPDDLYPDRTIEVKAFKEDLHLQLIKGDIPTKILAQIHFGMLICGKKMCDFLPYNPKFARKLLEDGSPNPDFDPKKAFKIITIRYNPKIAANFKSKLLPQKVAA